jgi:CheY-like chemotaxis protein
MPGHALIIEPDPSLAKRFQETLGCAGVILEVTANANEGIAAAQRRHPDVIVLDADLLESAEAEKRNYWSLKTNPLTKHVPIVVLIQHERERVAGERYRPLWGDYELPKNMFLPFTLFELLRFMEIV